MDSKDKKPVQKLRETVLLLQANQEKLARMLGSINAMFLMCFRLSKLHEAGKMSHADASMVKAWTTLRGGLPTCCIAWWSKVRCTHIPTACQDA